jgi:2'-5' RNA ligase
VTPPLVLTLEVDDDAQRRLQALRSAHFPPDRDVVPAHVSLFHALPGDALATVLDDVRAVTQRAPFGVDVTGVRSLGRGTALVLSSPDLLAVRTDLAACWEPWLSRQDRQRFAPHVTIQNKVEPGQARELLDRLRGGFQPWRMTATGLRVWRYLGGPWGPVDTVLFPASA